MPLTINVKIEMVPFGAFVFRQESAPEEKPTEGKSKVAPYEFPSGTGPVEPQLLLPDSLVEFT
jgi:hypothetical protein